MNALVRTVVVTTVLVLAIVLGLRCYANLPRDEPTDRVAARETLAAHTVVIDSQLLRSERARDSSARAQRLLEANERRMRAVNDSLHHAADSLARAAAEATTAADSARAWRAAYALRTQEADSLRQLAESKDIRIRMLVADTTRLRTDLDSTRSLIRQNQTFQARLERDLAKAERRPTWKQAVVAVLAAEGLVAAARSIAAK